MSRKTSSSKALGRIQVSFLLTLMCVFLSGTAATARQGGQDIGGGNAYELEFKKIGKELLRDIKSSQLTEKELQFSLSSFEEALSVQIYGSDSSSTIIVDGETRHAMNSLKSHSIVFSNEVWSHLNSEQKRGFVLHEYMRFMRDLQGERLNDASGDYSSNVLVLLSRKAKTSAEQAPTTAKVRTEGSRVCSLTYYNFSRRFFWDFSPSSDQNEITIYNLKRRCLAETNNYMRCAITSYAFCEGEPLVRAVGAVPAIRYVCTISHQMLFALFLGPYIGRGETLYEAQAKSYEACLKNAPTAWLTCEDQREGRGKMSCKELSRNELGL